jgi:hypothetical protein
LGSFGPIAILFLFGVWAGCLVVGFGLLHWSLCDMDASHSIGGYLYLSGVTFFTLGYGDFVPATAAGRFLSVIQAGTGYAFLAIVIGFVPTFYQAFSRREKLIVMLDSRAGSNPTAGQLILRYASANAMPSLQSWLKDAEGWCAEQLENYLSYPVLAFYRSQHDDQSWLAAMNAILDTCVLILSMGESEKPWASELRFQAKSTYAMGRHVIVDLAYLIDEPPDESARSRMGERDRTRLVEALTLAYGSVPENFFEKLDQLRATYEPYLVGLARDMHFVLPAWTPVDGEEDNWQRSAWDEKHF